jgi:hypothetical protein
MQDVCFHVAILWKEILRIGWREDRRYSDIIRIRKPKEFLELLLKVLTVLIVFMPQVIYTALPPMVFFICLVFLPG